MLQAGRSRNKVGLASPDSTRKSIQKSKKILVSLQLNNFVWLLPLGASIPLSPISCQGSEELGLVSDPLHA